MTIEQLTKFGKNQFLIEVQREKIYGITQIEEIISQENQIELQKRKSEFFKKSNETDRKRLRALDMEAKVLQHTITIGDLDVEFDSEMQRNEIVIEDAPCDKMFERFGRETIWLNLTKNLVFNENRRILFNKIKQEGCKAI